jgi:hypothetical protein
MWADNVCNDAMLILNSEFTDLAQEETEPEPELVEDDLGFNQSITWTFLFQGYPKQSQEKAWHIQFLIMNDIVGHQTLICTWNDDQLKSFLKIRVHFFG